MLRMVAAWMQVLVTVSMANSRFITSVRLEMTVHRDTWGGFENWKLS